MRKWIVFLFFSTVLLTFSGVASAAPQLWDNFTDATLNMDKWELIAADKGNVTIESERARVLIEESNDSGSRSWYRRRLIPKTAARFPYIQATVNVSSTSSIPTPSGATRSVASATIRGKLYNTNGFYEPDSTNGHIGNVEYNLGVFMYNNGDITVEAHVNRALNAEWTESESLWSHTFLATASKDSDYTLAVEYRRNAIIFSCNGTSAQYDISTGFYYPFDWMGSHLESLLYLEHTEAGTLLVNWDEVIVYGDPNPGNFTQTRVVKSVSLLRDTVSTSTLTVNQDGTVEADGDMVGRCSDTGIMGGTFTPSDTHIEDWSALVNANGLLQGYFQVHSDVGALLDFGYFYEEAPDDDSGGCFMSIMK